MCCGICKVERYSRAFAVAMLLCAAALPTVPNAVAQEAPNSRPITFGLGGMVAPNVDSGLKWGWDLQAGAGIAVTPWSHHRDWRLYLSVNLLFEHLGVKSEALGTTASMNSELQEAIGAKARFYSVTFDPTIRFGGKRRVSGYVLGGAGWLRRSIDFTGPATGGILVQPTAPSILSPGSSSMAVDAGAGMNLRLGGPGSVMWFAELRYVRGLAINRTTTLIPVSIGFRW
jgi:hypothetical protein